MMLDISPQLWQRLKNGDQLVVNMDERPERRGFWVDGPHPDKDATTRAARPAPTPTAAEARTWAWIEERAAQRTARPEPTDDERYAAIYGRPHREPLTGDDEAVWAALFPMQ